MITNIIVIISCINLLSINQSQFVRFVSKHSLLIIYKYNKLATL